ncbi:MAG: hypothetical protein WCP24_01150 [bacterium]
MPPKNINQTEQNSQVPPVSMVQPEQKTGKKSIVYTKKDEISRLINILFVISAIFLPFTVFGTLAEGFSNVLVNIPRMFFCDTGNCPPVDLFSSSEGQLLFAIIFFVLSSIALIIKKSFYEEKKHISRSRRVLNMVLIPILVFLILIFIASVIGATK